MSRTPSRMPVVLTALAAGLVGGAIGAALFPPQVIQAPGDPAAGDPEAELIHNQDLLGLDRRLTLLEETMTGLAQSVLRTAEAAGEQPVIPTAELQDLLARLAALEASAGTGSGAPEPEVPLEITYRHEADDPAHSDASWHHNHILTSTSLEEKLASWGRLRRMGPDAWTDQVVQEMVRVGQTAENDRIRADVWRQADARARHPAIQAALLQAMVQDPSGRVRGEAAETLENYCDDPSVAAALRQASLQDPDPEVRENANKALRKLQEDRDDDKRKGGR